MKLHFKTLPESFIDEIFLFFYYDLFLISYYIRIVVLLADWFILFCISPILAVQLALVNVCCF